jgi:hypothetical protein
VPDTFLMGIRGELRPLAFWQTEATFPALAMSWSINSTKLGIVATSGVTGDAASPMSGTNSNLIGGYSNLLEQLFSRKYPTYSVGIQLDLPVRNRIAQADLTRDEFSQREIGNS